MTLAIALYLIVGAGTQAAVAVIFERSGDQQATRASVPIIFFAGCVNVIVWPFFIPMVLKGSTTPPADRTTQPIRNSSSTL